MTGEHLWSAWAGELFGEKNYVHSRKEEDGRVITWQGRELNVKAKVVCGECNHGWMSDLESRMKGVAADMVARGSRTSLGEKEIATIAAFGFLKSVVGDYMHENRPPFYTAEERHLFRGALTVPRGVQIWLAGMDGPHGVFKSMGAEAPLNTPGRIKLNVFTYGLGYLLIQVVGVRWMKKSRDKYSSPPLLIQDPTQDALSIPIWPTCDTPVLWPPPLQVPHKSVDPFVQRWINLSRGW
jgi:hypothetical protein